MDPAGPSEVEALARAEKLSRAIELAVSEAEARGDHSGSAMSLREKQLGLRHRDSFVIHKRSHPEEGGESGDSRSPGRSSIATLFGDHNLAHPRGGGGAPGGEDDVGLEGGEEGAASAGDGAPLPRHEVMVASTGGGGSPAAPLGPLSPAGWAPAPLSPLRAPAAGEAPAEEPPKRKNRLWSFVKGMGSAMGMRKGKKRRAREAAEAAAKAAGAAPFGALSGASPRPSSFSHGSSFGGGEDGDSFFDIDGGGSEVGGGVLGSGAPFEPRVDERGHYVPTHRLHPGSRGILKPSPIPPGPGAVGGAPRPAGSALSAGWTVSPSGGGGGGVHAHVHFSSAAGSPRPGFSLGGGGGLGTPGTPTDDTGGSEGLSPASAPGAALTASAAKRNLSFADQHGHDLHVVRTADNLHYSENAQHQDWPGEGKRCSVV